MGIKNVNSTDGYREGFSDGFMAAISGSAIFFFVIAMLMVVYFSANA